MRNASIIIPCFKRIDQTVKTIELLRASHRKGVDFDIEIIVADSTPDDSLEKTLRQKFADKVLYTRPAKEGVAANKNQGARIAKYPILIFCDSDMEVEPDSILHILNALDTHTNAGMIGGQVVWKGGEKDGQIDRPRSEDRMNIIDKTTYIEALYSRFIATYKKVFENVGGYDEIAFNMRGEGSDLSIRYWRAGYPLVYSKEIKVHHVHEASDSVALRVNHPEWGVAKDLLLLVYKYDMLEGDYPYFMETVHADFNTLGKEGYGRIIQGIGRHLDLVTRVKSHLDSYRATEKGVYDFKFLEVFSNQHFPECIEKAEKLIHQRIK